MQSTFSGVELSKRALFAQMQGLTTVGHNLSNINTAGYSKQNVRLQSTQPLYEPGAMRRHTPGQIGQGVDIAAIVRQRDMQIEGQIVEFSHLEGFWNKKSSYMLKLEEVYNEVGNSSLRNAFDKFWESWQEVSVYPEQVGSRQVLVRRSETLMSEVKTQHSRLSQIEEALNTEVNVIVGTINTLLADISALNRRIEEVRQLGDNPNDLLDRRDVLVGQLSHIINVQTDESDPDEFFVHFNGKVIVQGKINRPLEVYLPENSRGNTDVRWADTQDSIDRTGGTLSAVLELRDTDVKHELDNLNLFTISLTDAVNRLHRQGFGLTGETGVSFFTESSAVIDARGNFDSDNDGVLDQTLVYSLGGAHSLDSTALIGFEGEITLERAIDSTTSSTLDPFVTIGYGANDTVQDVIDRINASGSQINAYLDNNSRLIMRAVPSQSFDTPDFVIKSIADTGEFLAGYSGLLANPGSIDSLNAYTWQTADALSVLNPQSDFGVAPFKNPSAYTEVNAAIVEDPRLVAASEQYALSGGEPGDGNLARKIASLRSQNIQIGLSKNFNDFFADALAFIGSKGEEAETKMKTYDLILQKLGDQQQAVAGVNLDEELQDMIKYQTGYEAAARFLTNLEEMYEVLLTMV